MNDICGILVHSRPERAPMVGRILDARPGVEVHAVTDDGRLVVSVEGTRQAPATDVIAGIHDIDGVVNASLIYHHCDAELDLDEEVPA